MTGKDTPQDSDQRVAVRDPMAHPISPRRPLAAAQTTYTIEVEDLHAEGQQESPGRMWQAAPARVSSAPEIEPLEPVAYPHLPLRPKI